MISSKATSSALGTPPSTSRSTMQLCRLQPHSAMVASLQADLGGMSPMYYSQCMIRLRPVQPADLQLFYENQADPESARLVAFTTRNRADFDAHWARLMGDPSVTMRAISIDDQLAGHVASFPRGGGLEL